MARCINCLERPDSGKVIVDGVDILSLSKEALRQERRKIGMIFQTFNLFDSKTVYQNIALPLTIVKTPKREVDQRVRDAAELVHLSDKLDAYPGALSGGQEQRVGIARAIISNPDILLSDEATSALDPQTTIQILDLLKEINRKTGLTILMITHEMDAIKYTCSRMAVLDDGQVVESGYVDDIFRNPKSHTGSLFTRVFLEMQDAVPVADGAGI